jgi:glycerophosphoryl diester phosphodiesterase
LRLFAAIILVIGGVGAAVASIGPGVPTLTGAPPTVIAHRGASGALPEHTLQAYARAIDLGADFVEPDLVITRDGVLVARHERQLGRTTDVSDHPEFADRRVRKDGAAAPDWHVEDFTLAELRTLRARQTFPGRSRALDDQFGLATFDDILALVRAKSREHGRPVGVYAELKTAEVFSRRGLQFIGPLLEAADRHGFGPGRLPLFVQSFDADVLRRLAARADIPVIVLLADAGGRPSVPLDEAARFAVGVSAAKSLLIDPETGEDTGLVAEAHRLGLTVFPWTFRNDAVGDGFAGPRAELRAYLDLGVDGVITDFADTAVSVRADFLAGR